MSEQSFRARASISIYCNFCGKTEQSTSSPVPGSKDKPFTSPAAAAAAGGAGRRAAKGDASASTGHLNSESCTSSNSASPWSDLSSSSSCTSLVGKLAGWTSRSTSPWQKQRLGSSLMGAPQATGSSRSSRMGAAYTNSRHSTGNDHVVIGAGTATMCKGPCCNGRDYNAASAARPVAAAVHARDGGYTKPKRRGAKMLELHAQVVRSAFQHAALEFGGSFRCQQRKQ